MLYSIVLPLHNIVRWVVVLAALFAIVRAWMGWFGKKPWAGLDNQAGMIYTMAIDIQVLLGLLLYFSSPLVMAALRNFGGAMSNSDMRFFALEHILVMIISLALSHVGRTLSRKASDPVVKHRQAAIWYTVSFLLILALIPWGRPMIRFW
jgi:hypothetical protein